MRCYSRLSHYMEMWSRELCYRDITHIYSVCWSSACYPMHFSFYPRLPNSKQVNEWNREWKGRYEAHGRRAQGMTHLVIGWMLVLANLSNKSENVGQKNAGGGAESPVPNSSGTGFSLLRPYFKIKLNTISMASKLFTVKHPLCCCIVLLIFITKHVWMSQSGIN